MTFYDRLTQRLLRGPVESTLGALIGVMDDVGRSALLDRHVQRGHDEFGTQMGFHRPANHAPAPRVEDDGEIREPGPRRDVRDISQ